MTTTWWTGTALVYQRGLVERLRSRSFKAVTALMLVLSVATVTLPQVLGGGPTTYHLATVGTAPAEVVAALDTAGGAGEFDVEYVTRDSPDEVREAVRNGDATVGIAGDTLYTAVRQPGIFPAVVSQTLVSLETSRRLADLGLTPEQAAELQSIQPPEQVSVAPVQDEGRAAVGYVLGIVLYLALLFAGSAIATSVAVEKSTRISEVLLAVLRPSQLLVGTVLAVGTVTLVQLGVLVAPLAVAVQVSDSLGLPPVASGDIALGIGWFLLGFTLYSFLYAALGALADKVTEVGTVTLPVVFLLVGGYMLSIYFITVDGDAHDPWSVLLSIFPFTAPVAMPLRWAAGDVPVWQLVLAMALTAATAVAIIGLASRVYRRALVITGHRVKFAEVVGAPAKS